MTVPIPDLKSAELRAIARGLELGGGPTLETRGLARRCIETAAILDAANESAGGPIMLVVSPTMAVCFNVGGRFHGWLFTRHPEGQWVSRRKLERDEIPEPFPLLAREKSGT